ncbi:hypothetical protein RKD26_002686 [Streptomyces calvus]
MAARGPVGGGGQLDNRRIRRTRRRALAARVALLNQDGAGALVKYRWLPPLAVRIR